MFAYNESCIFCHWFLQARSREWSVPRCLSALTQIGLTSVVPDQSTSRDKKNVSIHYIPVINKIDRDRVNIGKYTNKINVSIARFVLFQEFIKHKTWLCDTSTNVFIPSSDVIVFYFYWLIREFRLVIISTSELFCYLFSAQCFCCSFLL